MENTQLIKVSQNGQMLCIPKLFHYVLSNKLGSFLFDLEYRRIYRVFQKLRPNGALRCRRDYRKRQKNV
jgi:hypothetical protein